MAKNKKVSPLKEALTTLQGLQIGLGVLGMFGSSRKSRQAGAEKRRYEQQLAEANADLDRRMLEYEESKFTPIDPDIMDRENIYEDLEVDMDAVDYAREQFQQQQANIMQAYRGVAGASGIAALAQSLSNQAKEQAKETRIDIGTQLADNRKLKLREQAQREAEIRAMKIANIEGERQFEIDKMSTLIGVAGQRAAGAQQGVSQAAQNQMQAQGQMFSMASSLINTLGGGTGSK